jgi:hypothetical protein
LMGVVLHFLAAFHAFMKPSSSRQKVFFQKLKTRFHACPAMLCFFSNLGAKQVGWNLAIKYKRIFLGFLLILGTCWKLLSKYGNMRIFWRHGTYFQNKSFISSHIDLFGLPGCTEEKKNDCPVSNPYLLICHKRT